MNNRKVETSVQQLSAWGEWDVVMSTRGLRCEKIKKTLKQIKVCNDLRMFMKM